MGKNVEKEKILEGEVLDEMDENGEESKVAEQPDPKPADETKKDESENKEFFLWRGAKAVGRGIAKTGKAVGGFIKKHPYVSSGISAGLGFAAKYGIDFLMNRSSSEAAPAEEQAEETQLLPEPDAEIDLDFEEPETEETETISERNDE